MKLKILGINAPAMPIPAGLAPSKVIELFIVIRQEVRDAKGRKDRLASRFHTPPKLLLSSVTTSAAIQVSALVLRVLPAPNVGRERLILGGVGVAVGGWLSAPRHGQRRELVEANKSGADETANEAENEGGT